MRLVSDIDLHKRCRLERVPSLFSLFLLLSLSLFSIYVAIRASTDSPKIVARLILSISSSLPFVALLLVPSYLSCPFIVVLLFKSISLCLRFSQPMWLSHVDRETPTSIFRIFTRRTQLSNHLFLVRDRWNYWTRKSRFVDISVRWPWYFADFSISFFFVIFSLLFRIYLVAL